MKMVTQEVYYTCIAMQENDRYNKMIYEIKYGL